MSLGLYNHLVICRLCLCVCYLSQATGYRSASHTRCASVIGSSINSQKDEKMTGKLSSTMTLDA